MGGVETDWGGLLRQSQSERLETVARAYWRPVFRHIRAKWNRSVEDALDLTQAFFLALLERSAFSGVHPSRGRLRHYLKACLDHFMLSVRRGERSVKRGGRHRRVPLESVTASTRDPGACEVLDRLAVEDPDAAKLFREYYLEGGETYRSLAARHGKSEDDVDNLLRWARARCREIIDEGLRGRDGSHPDVPTPARLP